MTNLDIVRMVRVNEELNSKIDHLMMRFPDKYSSRAHVIRCALMQLYAKEVKDGRDKDQDMRPRDSRIE